MPSHPVSHTRGSSNARSHVFVLLIDDDDSEDVQTILDRLRWKSTGMNFPSVASASLAEECCKLTLRRFDPTVGRGEAIHPSQYPTVERNLTLLAPDLQDAPPAFDSASPRAMLESFRALDSASPRAMAESFTALGDNPAGQSQDFVWRPAASDTDLDSGSEGSFTESPYLSIFLYVSCCFSYCIS